MVALIVGIAFIGLSVFAALPPLAWWDHIIVFFKGGAPVLGVFIGLVAVFIGIADIKDRIEAKKEEAEEAKKEETK